LPSKFFSLNRASIAGIFPATSLMKVLRLKFTVSSLSIWFQIGQENGERLMFALGISNRRSRLLFQCSCGIMGDLTLEFLAFAEGRFLTIHPFADFNGRTIRLFLLELLRRLDLPELELAPQSDQQREKYFLALEAADQSDWAPLIEIWQSRLTPEN
jgi:hypothetical protein